MCVLETIFKRLSQATLMLNHTKCEFGKAMVTYLGKQVGQEQVRPVHTKVEAIVEFPTLATRRDLHRFLGMTGLAFQC